MVEEEVIASQLENLVKPVLIVQQKYYQQLGLRNRILNLPLMVAAVLILLWRNVAGVTELDLRTDTRCGVEARSNY